MKNRAKGIIAISTFVLAGAVWASPPDSPPDYETLTTGLGIGILYEPCIGNDKDGNLNDVYITEYGDEIEHNGFNSVRLRLSMDAFTDNSTGTYPNQTLTRDFFDGTKGMTRIIDDLLARNNGTMYVIISPKGLESGTSDDEAQQVIWWRQIAEEYQDYTHRLIFDLMNEPLIRDGEFASMIPIEHLNQALTDAIRPTNPTRYIIYHRQQDEYMSGSSKFENEPFSETGPGSTDFNMAHLPTNHNGYLLFDVHFLGDEDPSTGNGEGKRDERMRQTWEFRETTGYPVWSGAWNYGAWDTTWSTTEVTELVDLMKQLGIPGTYLMFNSSNTSIYDGNGTDQDGDGNYNEWTQPDYRDIVTARNPIFWQKDEVHAKTMYAPEEDGYTDTANDGNVDLENKEFSIDSNGIKEAYLKFRVCRLPDGTVTGAKLRFKVRDLNNSSDTISVHLADHSNWDESDNAERDVDPTSNPALDLASAPSYGPALDNVTVTAEDDGSSLDTALNDHDWLDPLAYSDDSWYELDVSSAITGPGTYTFVLTGSSKSRTDIWSRDCDGTVGVVGTWKYYPRLEVTVNPSAAANHAPVWSGNPLVKSDAVTNVAYSGSLAGDATDSDSGDTLRFGKSTGPWWLTVKQDGSLVGTPGSGDLGLNEWDIEVSDGHGGTATTKLQITVNATGANQPPVFNSDPFTKSTATENSLYSGSIASDASDPEGDSMSFSKTGGPAWLSVASDGTLSGTPGSGDVGANSFTVQVSATGGSDTATLNITVDAASGGGALSTNTFTVAEDTFADGKAMDTNHGTESSIELKKDGASAGQRVGYLKFNVSGLSGTVQSVLLHLYSDTEVDIVNALQISDNTWTETGLTWNNQPARGSVINGGQASASSWFTIDVTSYVTGNGTFSIALDEQGNSRQKLNSREGANAPYLEVVTQAPADTPATRYAGWTDRFPTLGSATNRMDNFDGDGLNNLAEYAIGGNPTNGADEGRAPEFQTVEEGGTNWIKYVYVRRNDAAARGLNYSLEQSTDLLSNVWTNAPAEEIGTGVLDTEFDSITNRVPTGENAQFIRLRVEYE